MTTAERHHPSSREAQAPPFLTVADFHDHFRPSVGLNTIYDLVRSGRIRSIKFGARKILIPDSELVDWPQREREQAEP